MDPLTGQRNGDPIADCFACITYPQGAVLALADGVNWGQRPKQAARAAVHGFCTSLHQQLALTQGERRATAHGIAVIAHQECFERKIGLCW